MNGENLNLLTKILHEPRGEQRTHSLSRFHLIKEHLVEFNQLAAAHAEGSEDMLNRVMLRDNIGIMALLESVDSPAKEKLVVTNAHIHWDPEFKDVKLIQVVMLMRELTRFMHEYAPGSLGKGNSTHFCFIFLFSFDFNPSPRTRATP